MSEHSMEGVWIITRSSPTTDYVYPTVVQRSDDPWLHADEIDYSLWPDGYRQHAERFARSSCLDIRSCHQIHYVRQVVSRSLHNPCKQCDGSGEVDDPHEPEAMWTCPDCDGHRWYWQTTGEQP